MIFDKLGRRRQQKPSTGEEDRVDRSIENARMEGQGEASSDEMLIQSVQKFRDEMRHVAAKVANEYEESLGEAKKRIEYSENFVRETGIDRSLLLMLAEMWHWPSWCKRDDFAKYKTIHVTLVSAEDIKGENVVS